MSSYVSLKYNPLNKGYFDMPYWLVEKIKYISRIINNCIEEKENKEKRKK